MLVYQRVPRYLMIFKFNALLAGGCYRRKTAALCQAAAVPSHNLEIDSTSWWSNGHFGMTNKSMQFYYQQKWRLTQLIRIGN